jgi:uncharacterized membrane protein YebE (DUF533 family)
MAQFDLGGILGAVLGGGGRTRGRSGGQQQLGRAIAVLAGAAIEAMAKAQQAPAPAPEVPPRSGARRPAPAGWDQPVPAGQPARKPAPMRGSVPSAGGPWGRGTPSAKPAPTANDPWSPVPGAPPPPPIAAEDREGLLMLRAMIAAAKADGQVDADERARIADQLEAAGLSPAARDAVLAEFGQDATAQALAREASDPMLAAQLYAAAVAGAATIEGAERAWLDDFAKALRLDRAATDAIESRIRGR